MREQSSAVDGGCGTADVVVSAVTGGGGITEQDPSVVAGGGITEQDGSAVTGGGGMLEHVGSAVFGGGGMLEHDGSAVTGGGGILEQTRAVDGGGGITDRPGAAPAEVPHEDERRGLSAPGHTDGRASVNASPSSSPESSASHASDSIHLMVRPITRLRNPPIPGPPAGRLAAVGSVEHCRGPEGVDGTSAGISASIADTARTWPESV